MYEVKSLQKLTKFTLEWFVHQSIQQGVNECVGIYGKHTQNIPVTVYFKSHNRSDIYGTHRSPANYKSNANRKARLDHADIESVSFGGHGCLCCDSFTTSQNSADDTGVSIHNSCQGSDVNQNYQNN